MTSKEEDRKARNSSDRLELAKRKKFYITLSSGTKEETPYNYSNVIFPFSLGYLSSRTSVSERASKRLILAFCEGLRLTTFPGLISVGVNDGN